MKTMNEAYSYELKIPKDRVAVLIGTEGETKSMLEEVTETKIDVDSQEGDVKITGEDALKLYQTREIIRAISRGFNPEVATLLIKPDYIFELINLMDFVKGKNHLLRVKGRIIGTGGKSRQTIEVLTETHISVYGKTVGIIGLMDGVQESRKAIDALLSGSSHANVYKGLERFRREQRREKVMMKEG